MRAKMENRKFLWVVGGVVFVAVLVLGYYLFNPPINKEPVKVNSPVNVNSAPSVISYDWCVPGKMIIEEGLIKGEENFRVLRGTSYEGEEVCHVRSELNRKNYYFTETRDKVFELKSVNGRLVVTPINNSF